MNDEEKNKKPKKQSKVKKYVQNMFGLNELTEAQESKPITLGSIFSKENTKSLIILGAYFVLFIAIFVAAAFNKEDKNSFEQDEENNTVVIESEEELLEDHYQYLLDNDYDYKITFNINETQTIYVGSVEDGDIIGYLSNEEILSIEELNNIEDIYNNLQEREYVEEPEGTKLYELTPEEFMEIYPDVELVGYSSGNISITTTENESYITDIKINLNGHIEDIYEISVEYTTSIY